MKTNALRLLPLVPLLLCPLFAQNQTVTGNLTVTGTIGSGGIVDSAANEFIFGTQGGLDAVSLFYTDDAMPAGTVDTLKFTLKRVSASWLWAHAVDGTNPTGKAMRLDSAHQLILYQANGTTAGITLTPASNQLSLGTATLTASGTTITANGALSFAGDITNTSATAKAAIGGAADGSFTLTLKRAAGASADGNLSFGDGVQWTRLNSNATSAAYNPMVMAGDHSYIFSNGSTGTGALVIAPWSSTAGTGLRMLASGYVGIGATTPLDKLHVKGSLSIEAAANTTRWRIVPEPTTDDRILQFENSSSRVDGGFTFKATNVNINAVRLKINNDGNVGIGTTSPGSKLQVVGGTVRSDLGATGQSFVGTGTGSNLQVSHDGSSYVALHNSGGGIQFRGTDGTSNLLTIASSGNVGIGTTGPGSATKLQVNGRGLFTGGIIDPGDGSPSGVAIGFNTSGTYGFIDAVQTGVSPRTLAINASGGSVGIGTTTPGAQLDVRAGSATSIYAATGGAGAWGADFHNLDGGGDRYVKLAGGTHAALFMNGNVGIGTTSPTSKLVIKPTTDSAQLSLWQYNWDGGFEFKAPSDGSFGIFRSTISTPRILIDSTGNVGIGTASPSRKLSVYGQYPEAVLKSSAASGGVGGSTLYFGNAGSDSVGWLNYNHTDNYLSVRVNEAERLRINAAGNVGIGTSSPGGKLQILSPDAGTGTAKVYSTVNGFGLILDQYYSAASEAGGSYVRTADVVASTGDVSSSQIRFLTKPANANPTVAMLLSGNGNVGIGTTSPTHKLSVNGTIRAKEVIVDTGWADYVFEEDYRLAPLSEVESHIKAKKHLPGIPSAAEVAEHGVSMGDMQAKLLSKVEELTLHLIAQEKELAALRSEVAQLKASSTP